MFVIHLGSKGMPEHMENDSVCETYFCAILFDLLLYPVIGESPSACHREKGIFLLSGRF